MEDLTQSSVVKLMKNVQSVYFYSLFLFSSSLVVLVLQLIKSYSGISLVSVLQFNIDRNHVFLICNGILAILVKSSSSPSTSSSQDSNSEYTSSSITSSRAVVQSNDQGLPRSVVLTDQRKQQEELSALSSEQRVTTDAKVERFPIIEETVISEVLHFHQKVVISECKLHVREHGDDDHGKDDEEEGAEELNKRCEDFIRRMRQGIISESRKDFGLARFS